MRNKTLLVILLSLLSGAAAGKSVAINPHGVISSPVSNTDPNMIAVNDDRIVSIQATQGVLTSRNATESGAVVFSTVATKPFTVFVQTESGFSFTLQATPGKQQGAALVVNNLRAKGGEAAAGWEKEHMSYTSLISSLVARFINNDQPKGFIFSEDKNVEISPSVSQAFTVRPVTAWRGNALRIVRLEMTNRTSSKLELNERWLWSKGVMAISFWPRLDVISPGTTVSAIVVFREVEPHD